MLSVKPEMPEYFLWRFLVEARHQRGGTGSAALRLVIEHVRSLGAKELFLSYVPGDVCLELKSLKFYLWSFRNEGVFYERAVNRILDDLVAASKPKWMKVVGDFNVRGGIKSVITATHGSR